MGEPAPAGGSFDREASVVGLRDSLLAWYDEHRRALPWRAANGDSIDPYRVWVSEVMLQQTRVETVRGYYERWLQRFPTLESLAGAPLDDVLKAWEGMGYYSRARNLHRAVREVAERYGGRVPDAAESFLRLPGVGRYTAGAVMSIAFGRQEPVVDGNVRRVFARLLDEPAPAEARLWRHAADLVRGPRPGDLNQALMELGATVCTPRSPRCGACPVREWCGAHGSGTQAERPSRRAARALPHEDVAVAIVADAGRLLLARRRPDLRLGGLWEFPGTACGPDESTATAAERGVRDGLRVAVRTGEAIGTVQHVFSHVRVDYHALRCTLLGGEPRAVGWSAWAWASAEELDRYALPAAQRRLAALLARPGSTGRPSEARAIRR